MSRKILFTPRILEARLFEGKGLRKDAHEAGSQSMAGKRRPVRNHIRQDSVVAVVAVVCCQSDLWSDSAGSDLDATAWGTRGVARGWSSWAEGSGPSLRTRCRTWPWAASILPCCWLRDLAVVYGKSRQEPGRRLWLSCDGPGRTR